MKFTNAIFSGLLGCTMAVPIVLKSFDSGVAKISAANTDPKADYRRDFELNVQTEEDPDNIKADYRRSVVFEIETGDELGELKADY